MQVQQASTAKDNQGTDNASGKGRGSAAAAAAARRATVPGWVAQQHRQWHKDQQRDDALRQHRPTPAQRVDQEGGSEGHAALADSLTCRRDADCESSPETEPIANQRDKWCEKGAAADKAGHEGQRIKLPECGRGCAEDDAGRHRRRRRQTNASRTDLVNHAPDDDSPKSDPEETEGIHEGDVRTWPAEGLLKRDDVDRQPIDELPHSHSQH